MLLKNGCNYTLISQQNCLELMRLELSSKKVKWNPQDTSCENWFYNRKHKKHDHRKGDLETKIKGKIRNKIMDGTCINTKAMLLSNSVKNCIWKLIILYGINKKNKTLAAKSDADIIQDLSVLKYHKINQNLI